MANNISIFRLNVLTGISFISILLPVSFWGLWIHCFNSRDNQVDRVKMFESYFPEYVNGHSTITLISLLLCALSMVLASIYWEKKTVVWKIISIILLIAGGLILMLTLFSLM